MMEPETVSNPPGGEPINPKDMPSGATYDGGKRPLYFTEQFLVVEDFKDEEHYHLGMTRRHNRCLHTPGVVAGLEVTIQENTPAPGTATLTVGRGSAIDNFGREIILAAPATRTFDAPAGNYERYVVIAFKEVKSTDESDTKVPTGGKPGVKRAVQAPVPQVTDTDPRTQWPRNLDDDPVLIAKLVKADPATPVKISRAGAGARIPTGGALSFQQAVVDPADARQRVAPPVQMGVDFADGALRIRARVSDPVNLDTTQLVIQQATGNVGIGITSPRSTIKLEISSDVGFAIQATEAKENGAAVVGTANTGASAYGIFGISSSGFAGTFSGDVQIRSNTPKPGSLTVEGSIGIGTGTLNLSDPTKLIEKITGKAPDNMKMASEGVFAAMKTEAGKPVPRLIIEGDVIIFGRLLVMDISEYGGRVYRRGGGA